MELIDLIPAAGITFTMISFFYMVMRNKFQDLTCIKDDLSKVKERITSLETKITPFWNWIDKELPNMIKGKSGRADILLTKYLHNPGLTDDEKWELVDLLKDKYCESKDTGERLALSLFILRLGGKNDI
jgi:hypothetical protein